MPIITGNPIDGKVPADIALYAVIATDKTIAKCGRFRSNEVSPKAPKNKSISGGDIAKKTPISTQNGVG